MPKSILFVSTVPQMLRACLLPFADHFRKRSWRVDAMAAGIKKNLELNAHFDQLWEIDFSRNPFYLKNLFFLPRQIRHIVEKQAYDIVHVHTPVAAFITRFALRRLKQRPKIIYTAHGFHFYHGGHFLKNKIFWLLEKIAGRWTDYLIVINREDEAAAKRSHFLPAERIIYMPGIGIDLEKYHPDRVPMESVLRLKAELNIAEKSPIFLQIAEFTPQKNHAITLRALAALPEKNAHLLFAGIGKCFPLILQLAKQLHIAHRVHFLGYRTDIPILICAANAVLLVSDREGLSRSVMEAMSLKTPVIGTNIRGIRDLLQQGAGILIPSRNVIALTQAMRKILADPQAAKAMGEKGSQQVKQYHLNHIIELHEELYRSPLKR